MISYNFYKIDTLGNIESKNFTEGLFSYDSINFNKINSNHEGYTELNVTIVKDYNDKIQIIDEEGQYKTIGCYRKHGILEIYLKNNIMFIKGSYIDKQNLQSLINKHSDIKQYLHNPTNIDLDLYKAIQNYTEFKTLSIRDFSATITKLKTTGSLSLEDHDVSNIINRSDDVTATTITYPFGTNEFDIHIDKHAKIGLKENDNISTISEQLSLLDHFYNEFILRYIQP